MMLIRVTKALSNVLKAKWKKRVEILQTGIVTEISTSLEGRIIVKSKLESNDIYRINFDGITESVYQSYQHRSYAKV